MKTKPTRSHPVLNEDSGKIVRGLLCIFFLSLFVYSSSSESSSSFSLWFFLSLFLRLLGYYSLLSLGPPVGATFTGLLYYLSLIFSTDLSFSSSSLLSLDLFCFIAFLYSLFSHSLCSRSFLDS
jgi:hypothetical protein